jgi:hypothetical protein
MPVPPLNTPHEIKFVLTTSNRVWVVTGAGAYTIDPKTGISNWIGEHPILERDVSALAATTELLSQTEGVRGAEELRLQAGKFIAALVAKLETEVGKTAKQVA